MGLGLKEFKIMYNKINEIALEHNIDYGITVEKFLNDLDNYDDYLTLKDKVEIIKARIFSSKYTNIKSEKKYLCPAKYRICITKSFENGIVRN